MVSTKLQLSHSVACIILIQLVNGFETKKVYEETSGRFDEKKISLKTLVKGVLKEGNNLLFLNSLLLLAKKYLI